MIDVLLQNHNGKELEQLADTARAIAARLSEDEWDWFLFSDEEKTLRFLEKKQGVDFACVEITGGKGVLVAEKTRENSEQAFIVVVADPSVSPMEYLKPSIMPGALLLRPYDGGQLRRVMRESLEKLLKEQPQNTGSFRLDLKTGSKLIPFHQIYFFEARNKKIALNIGSREFDFYDTIEHLQEELPPRFVRCHRSFIVSKAHIDQIYLSKNYLMLDNGMTIPLSRTYKSVLKELK